ncbi:MAG: hypothetical protein HXS48_26775 [Theionarchaea archaeon]|nr:MAG: hypothetical protein AYK19_15560 [Theionarchaea archaeon DG-70-1]MBU7030566.1 hypothetical protein [Theionarchaea archaeon]
MTIDEESLGKNLDVGDSNNTDLKRIQEPEINQREYLSELFSFACVLRGEVKHLEKIKEYIVQEYVDKGLVKLIKPIYEKREIYTVTGNEWKEYQKLKEKDERLIGYGFI